MSFLTKHLRRDAAEWLGTRVGRGISESKGCALGTNLAVEQTLVFRPRRWTICGTSEKV